MKNFSFTSLLLYLLLNYTIIGKCAVQNTMQHPPDNDSIRYKSSDPLSVPFKIRQKELMKGNLIRNSSFESGTKNNADSIVRDFRLDGWEKVGQNVEWVDTKLKHYKKDEVYDGSHAIKIIRRKANETDEGEGVLSDFIPVIPGTYDFYYDVMLKNISSNKVRMGTKLYDAIDVRIYFYDKDKNKIAGNIFYPYKKVLYDNTFKGYSFSNYWHIDNFGWSRVNARTYNYPFSEGDIPEGTAFVRLFLGLKGTGTMWVDNIDYRYSKWSFTALERMQKYFDKPLSYIDRLIPVPKKISAVKDYKYYEKGKKTEVLILLPAEQKKQDVAAAGIITNKLSKSMDDADNKIFITRIQIGATTINGNPEIIFSIGNTALYEKYSKKLPVKEIENKEQGYFIKQLTDNKTIIFLKGNDVIGDYYAATTVVQLIDDKKFVYHNSDVIDYPDFTGRAYCLKSWANEEELKNDINSIERMSLYKFNYAYQSYIMPGKDWMNPVEMYRKGMPKIGEELKKSGLIDFAFELNPYSHFDYEILMDTTKPGLLHKWSHSDPKSLQAFKDVIKIGLDAGAKKFMFCSDDFVPHTGYSSKTYSLYTDEDKKRFVNLQNAHAYVINEIYNWMKKDYPGTHLEFCPPWYLNEFIDHSEGRAETYFKELMMQIPEDVTIIWTGPTVRSLTIDNADIDRYKNLIGRYPMLWDNTIYARFLTDGYGGYPALYPSKSRMCNLFEAYDIAVPDDFYKYNDNRQIYINGDAYSEQYKLKYMTVADFEWNNNAYNADFSLWKALYSSFGNDDAKKILVFNDKYYELYEECRKIRIEGKKDENVAKANKALEELNNINSDLQNILTNKTLATELNNFKSTQEKEFYKLLERKNK